MPAWFPKWSARTRTARYQFLTVAVILTVGLIIAIGVSGIRQAPPLFSLPQLSESPSETDLLEHIRKMAELPIHIRAQYQDPDSENPAEDEVAQALAEQFVRLERAITGKANLSESRQRLFRSYHLAMLPSALGDEALPPALAAAKAAVAEQPEDAVAQGMLGDLHRLQLDFSAAATAYEAAGKVASQHGSRLQLLDLLRANRQKEKLRSLLEDPLYQASLEAQGSHGWRIHALVGDFAAVLRGIWHKTLEEIVDFPDLALLAVLSGLVWYLMLHQIGGIKIRTSWISLLAVVCGIISVVPTLTILTFQEHYNEMAEKGEFLNDLIYHVAGVALREEISKLALFAMLLPLIYRKSDAVILITAGCVGLGFGVDEAILYMRVGSEEVVVSRLFTATFFHVAATGLAGFALQRWIRFPRSCWEESLLTILGVIVVHGMYNFCMSAPVDATYDLSFFSIVMYALLAYRFLTTLKWVRENRGNRLSPIWIYLTGISLLIATTLIALSTSYGLDGAIVLLLPTVLSSVVLAALFYYQLKDL